MAQCFACRKPLNASWMVISADSPYSDSARYFDISDGYLLCTDSSYWIFCYCDSCWHRYVLALSLMSNMKQGYKLREQNIPLQRMLEALHQQNASLQQELVATEQSYSALQEEHFGLQQQLISSQAETISYKNQVTEMNEKYNTLANTSGIAKVRDLIKQLTSSQVDALRLHTTFCVETFEAAHTEQQVLCSKQFIMPIITQLKSGVDVITEHQNNILAKTKMAKESIFQTLEGVDVPQMIKDKSIQLLETEINDIEANIQSWNTFSVDLTNITAQQTSSVDDFIEIKVIEECD